MIPMAAMKAGAITVTATMARAATIAATIAPMQAIMIVWVAITILLRKNDYSGEGSASYDGPR